MLAGHPEVWDFLSENSEVYGPASDVGFFKGLVRDANSSVRRAVGDRVDEIDSWRRKLISAMPPVNLPEAPWSSARSDAGRPEEGGAEALLGRARSTALPSRESSQTPGRPAAQVLAPHSCEWAMGWLACSWQLTDSRPCSARALTRLHHGAQLVGWQQHWQGCC